MKKLTRLLYIVISTIMLSCATLAPAQQAQVTNTMSTLNTVVKIAASAVCMAPEPAQVASLVNSVNTVIAPSSVQITCPAQLSVADSAVPAPTSFSNFELTAIKGITLTYCANPIIGNDILAELNSQLSPITIAVTCK